MEVKKMTRKVNADVKAVILLIINEDLSALRDILTNVAHFVSKSVFQNQNPKRHKNRKSHGVVKSKGNSGKKQL